MWTRLKLTDEEKRWNSYRGENGLPAVVNRRYPYSTRLTSATQTLTTPHTTSRRSRVWKVTWSGDVQAVRVNIFTSVGEKFTVNPCHVPLISGQSPHSTYVRSPLVGTYPQTLTDSGGVATSQHAQPAYHLVIEPNLVLPGNVTLQFEYDLEDKTPGGDPILNAQGFYLVNHTVHVYEFPGFQGGAK